MLSRFSRTPVVETPATIRDSAAGRLAAVAAIPAEQLASLDRLAEVVELHPGDELATTDSLGTSCYFVLDGRLDVERDGTAVADVAPGWFAGEMSMGDQRRRNATLRVAEPTRAYRLGRGEFETLMATAPAIRAHVDTTIGVRRAG